MYPSTNAVEQRLKNLEAHLEQENPVLLGTVQSFRTLDRVAYGMGLLEKDQSYATQIPWWPLISVLGTFSAGKSTFVNHFLGSKLQRTGNQAVDDRFTVICYSRESTDHALPGVALDSDPRFPLYQISKDIELVSEGEGERIDTYLQLKASSSERLRGRILIDSPGFDADAQRTATLRITDHIIGLSDLVLVFFDARHPEPGAMRDTLKHLVADTIKRPDAGKFLYILNQLDTTAREDNPEDVIAAWQRAIGEEGLTAGRFYTIYNPDAAIFIEDAAKRARYEEKRDQDLKEIHRRMQEVEVERAYRIVSAVDRTAKDIEERTVPFLQRAIDRWRRRTLWGDGIVLGLALIALLAWIFRGDGLAVLQSVMDTSWVIPTLIIVAFVLFVAAHFGIRSLAAKSVARSLTARAAEEGLYSNLARAFTRNTCWWRTIFARTPVGWNTRARRRLRKVRQDADLYVQTLNDRFTNPSGDRLDSDLTPPRTSAESAATTERS
ncbi:dynamin family protein [Candidatus Thiosymbion oneisti]|uniref:dynamin family protein n=1 Tax=Candidatus Thiosymbion oneisti TaxID=589554 RepID=UPI000AEB77FF|nr:dynamin family protein [Candidatus Thiosymbion oneisti]